MFNKCIISTESKENRNKKVPDLKIHDLVGFAFCFQINKIISEEKENFLFTHCSI
jgi:hypothetical protein